MQPAYPQVVRGRVVCSRSCRPLRGVTRRLRLENDGPLMLGWATFGSFLHELRLGVAAPAFQSSGVRALSTMGGLVDSVLAFTYTEAARLSFAVSNSWLTSACTISVHSGSAVASSIAIGGSSATFILSSSASYPSSWPCNSEPGLQLSRPLFPQRSFLLSYAFQRGASAVSIQNQGSKTREDNKCARDHVIP